MTRRKHRRRQYGQGFSRPGPRQLYHLLFGWAGIKGPEKRTYLNNLASWMVIAIALCCGLFGATLIGLPGAIIGAIVGLWVGGTWIENGRFFR